MEPNELSFSIKEAQDNFGLGPIHDAFLTAATELMRGATVLAAAPPSESKWAFALVAGQILECSLKAFLAKKTGHDLSELWAQAANLDLPIGDMPQWAETLNASTFVPSIFDTRRRSTSWFSPTLPKPNRRYEI
jgi:HEPN domain-containing protein